MNSSGAGQKLMIGSYDHSNGYYYSIKGVKFLDFLNDY
jgi:hypothetical protein